ncbi:MAG TPA: tetratricopeptide repeat protein [Spirochaetia bacterium]|nr:tetratricopeptide repeat protein [Spirochaetia bacterium]
MKKILIPLLCLVASVGFAQNLDPWATQSTERELYMEADTRFLAGDYALALNRYDAFIRQFPLSQYLPDAQFRRAVTLYRLGDYSGSLDLFQRIEARYRSTRYLSLVPFWKGIDEYYLGDYAGSIQDLNVYLGEGAIPAGSPGASRPAEPVVDRQALLYRGLSLLALGRTAEAQATLESLVSGLKNPSDESYAFALLCSLYYRSGEYGKIVTLYEKGSSATIDPQWRAQIELYAAEADYFLGRKDAARTLYEGLESASSDIATVAFTRLFQLSAGDQAMQTAVLRSAEVALAGNTAVLSQFWLTVGIESYQSKKYDLSQFYFSRLWDLRASEHLSGAVPLYLAELMARKNDDTAAISTLETYLKEPWTKDAPISPSGSTAGAGAVDASLPGAQVEAGPVPLPKKGVQLPGAAATAAQEVVPTYRDRILARLGGLYLSNSNWAEAERYLLECRTDYPASEVYPQASYQYAYALYRVKDVAGSLKVVESLMTEGRTAGLTADLLRLQASDLDNLGRVADAISALQQYLTVRPADVDARVDLVRMSFKDKQYERVIPEAAKLLQQPDLLMRDRPASYVDLRYMLGLSYVATKAYPSAIEQLSLLENPGAKGAEIMGQSTLSEIKPYVLFYLGWCYYRDGQFSNAISAYGKLLQNSSAHELAPEAAYLAGWSAYSSEDYPAAERYLRLATGYDSTTDLSIQASFLLGQTLLQEKKYDESARAFRKIYTEHPDSSLADDAWFEYADSLAGAGNTDGAAEAYLQLVKHYPDSTLGQDALFRRAELFYKGGNFSAAREAFFLYRTTFPAGRQFDGALYWGGMCAEKLGEPSGALLLWERLIAEHRQSTFRSNAMYRAALIYEKRADYQDSLNLFSELLAQYPQEGQALGAKQKVSELVLLTSGLSQQEASLLVRINSDGKAKTDAGRAAILMFGRLVVYQEPAGSNNRQMVIPLLEQVVAEKATDPASAAEAQFLLADMAAAQNDYLKAATGFLDAAAMDPANRDRTAQSLYRAAAMLKSAGRSDQMKSLVGRIIQDFPKSEWASEARRLLE